MKSQSRQITDAAEWAPLAASQATFSTRESRLTADKPLLLYPIYRNNIVLGVFFADLERSLELWRVAPTL